ncbi:MAG: asparagine synthetase [Candidatus Thiodiazotropha sp.]
MTYKLLFAASLICLLTACQTLEEKRRSQSLQDTLRSYEATIRWSSGLYAGKFRDPQLDVNETGRQRKNIRVTHYEVVQGPTMLGDKRAVQTAVIQYVLQENQIVREITDQQVWLYDEAQEKWFLSSQVPEFK